MLDGAPLEGAVVTFTPVEEGNAAAGTTDASGKYNLSTWAKDDGAEAGRYRVTITKYNSPEGQTEAPAAKAPEVDLNSLVLEEEYPSDYDEMAESDQPASENVLPDKYAAPDTSGLEAQVGEDAQKNVFDFNIES